MLTASPFPQATRFSKGDLNLSFFSFSVYTKNLTFFKIIPKVLIALSLLSYSLCLSKKQEIHKIYQMVTVREGAWEIQIQFITAGKVWGYCKFILESNCFDKNPKEKDFDQTDLDFEWTLKMAKFSLFFLLGLE